MRTFRERNGDIQSLLLIGHFQISKKVSLTAVTVLHYVYFVKMLPMFVPFCGKKFNSSITVINHSFFLFDFILLTDRKKKICYFSLWICKITIRIKFKHKKIYLVMLSPHTISICYFACYYITKFSWQAAEWGGEKHIGSDTYPIVGQAWQQRV